MTKRTPNEKESVGFQPRYQRLAQMLEDDIIIRGLKNGDFFCTLKDLVERYGISIRTIRNTVLLLVKKGVLSVISARGIYVKNLESLYTFHSLKNVLLYPGNTALRRSAFFDQRSNAMMKVFGEQGFLVRAIPEENVHPSSILALSEMMRHLAHTLPPLKKCRARRNEDVRTSTFSPCSRGGCTTSGGTVATRQSQGFRPECTARGRAHWHAVATAGRWAAAGSRLAKNHTCANVTCFS